MEDAIINHGPNTNTKSPKNLKFIIPIIILAISTCGLGGYLIYDKCLQKDEIKTASTETTTNNTEDTAASPIENEASTISDNFSVARLLFDNQVTNSDRYNYRIADSNTKGIGFLINEDHNSLHAGISWSEVNDRWSINSLSKYQNVTIPYNQKIVSILTAGIGQAETYLFVLLEDGTIEYTNLLTAAKNNDFTSQGKVPNVENIINLQTASYSPKEGPTGGGVTVLACSTDGTFYDLGAALND